MLRSGLRSLRLTTAALAFALVVVTGVPAVADELPVPTNLALLKSLTEKALNEILDSLSVPSDEPLYIEAAAHHETNWLVAESLAELLRRRGFAPIILETGARSAAPTSGAQPGAQAEADDDADEIMSQGDEDDITSPKDEVGENDIFGSDEEDEFGDDEEGEEGLGDEDEGELGDEDEDEGEFGDEDVSQEDEDGEEGSAGEGADAEVGSSRGGRRVATGADVSSLISQQLAATPPPAPEPATPTMTKVEGEILRFRVLDLGVTYPKSKRALLLLGPRSITRLTGAHLRVTHVRGPEGKVKGVADSEWHNIDRFPGSVRPYVEGANYPFTPPEMKPAPWGRLVEPAIVLGIVSGLVYLFYANQS